MFGKVVIKNRVDVIHADMIKNRNLKVCILPDSVKRIGSETFLGCSNLKEIIFVDEEGKIVNNKIEEIGDRAFGATKIEKFIYSHHLRYIGKSAFEYTPLSVFEYQDDEFESNLKCVKKAFCHSNITNMVIPPSVKELTMCPEWKSLLCKDNQGSIIPFNEDFKLIGEYSNLEEISLLGENIKYINSILENGKCLKKVHLDIVNFKDMNIRMSGKQYEIVLYGETERLVCYSYSIANNVITFDSNTKIKYIAGSFFENICNDELFLPEGVEEIDFTRYCTPLKVLGLPSTLQKIGYVPKKLKGLECTVTIYKNLPLDSYTNLCNLLNPQSSKLIIKGEYFTEVEKKLFRSNSPVGLSLEFLESKPLDFQKSSNQYTVDELSQEIISLTNLMPTDFRITVQEKYNKIIDNYNEDRKKEEQAILAGRSIFVKNSYFDLRGELLNLYAEIILYQQDLIELKKVENYKKKILELKQNVYDPITLNNQNVDMDSIGNMIESIYTKISIFGYPVLYPILLEIERSVLEIERMYQNRINHLLDSSYTFSSFNPILQLNETLKGILVTLDKTIVQEAMELRGAFYPKYKDVGNIESLTDNIKSIYKATLTSTKLSREWNSFIAHHYSDLLDQILIRAINQEDIDADFADMKQKLKNDLILFLDKAVVISDIECYRNKKEQEVKQFCDLSTNYRDTKIQEISDSYQFFCNNKLEQENIKHTVSSLLMKEIMKMSKNPRIFPNSYNLQEIIKVKVDETIDTLKLMCDSKIINDILYEFYSQIVNVSTMETIDQKVEDTMKLVSPICKRENVDDVMQEFYKGLTDIWAQVWEFSSFQDAKVILKKL